MKSPKTNNYSKSSSNRDSFLEAFRELGTDLVSTASDNLVKGGVNDIKEALWPFTRPQEGNSSPDFSSQETELEKKYRSRVGRLENIHREEKVLFTREQKETRQQVNILQEEIQKLAKATADLASEAKEAEVTALQETPVTGTYHLNFLLRLRKVIAQLRSQIQESSYWLAAWNKKAGKKNYYWGQFKKSGSKFLLSSDRYMATQAG